MLVANNGLAAVKFMRSIRSWAYQTFGSSRAIALVAMATPEDIRINAEHITLADQFVEVGPSGVSLCNCVAGVAESLAGAPPCRCPPAHACAHTVSSLHAHTCAPRPTS